MIIEKLKKRMNNLSNNEEAMFCEHEFADNILELIEKQKSIKAIKKYILKYDVEFYDILIDLTEQILNLIKNEEKINNYLKNLKAKSNKAISLLNNEEQKKLIAKTKFLADICENKGLIDANKRRQIKNICNNCIEYNEELNTYYYDYLLDLLRN